MRENSIIWCLLLGELAEFYFCGMDNMDETYAASEYCAQMLVIALIGFSKGKTANDVAISEISFTKEV